MAGGRAPRARRLLPRPVRADAPQHEPPRLFKRPWGWLNNYIPWVLGPFFGESPETYFAHHVGMHHPENNLEDDISSTMPYQRDSVLRLPALLFPLLLRRSRRAARGTSSSESAGALMLRCIAGELLFYAVAVRCCLVDWRADARACSSLPFVITRFAMMAGNWGQHAFIDAGSPENCYRNSITCINCELQPPLLQRRLPHRSPHQATRHWTEMPEDFSRNSPKYEAEEAHRLRRDRLLRRVAVPDAQALRLAGEAVRAPRVRSMNPKRRRSPSYKAEPVGCEGSNPVSKVVAAE